MGSTNNTDSIRVHERVGHDRPKEGGNMSRAAELIDRATDNPAFDGLGGYYIFIRRVAIPLLIGVCMSSYYMSMTWFSHGTSYWREWPPDSAWAR